MTYIVDVECRVTPKGKERCSALLGVDHEKELVVTVFRGTNSASQFAWEILLSPSWLMETTKLGKVSYRLAMLVLH